MITIEDGNILDDKYTVICHQVNTLGIMGAGLAKQIKDKYSSLYKTYKKFCSYFKNLDILGHYYYYKGKDKRIFNIFAQDRINGSLPRTNYEALNKAFTCIKNHNHIYKITKLAIPYGIGCGLAGGDWNGVVYPMIQNIFKDAPFDVVIVKYDKR